jgi:hypothetical protein
MRPSEAVVYVPVSGATSVSDIDRGSAIVGYGDGRGDVRVYFEDDPGGAINLATFSQRALVAFERLADRAATHKVRNVPRQDLRVVGTFSASQRRVILVGPESEAALLAWLDVAELGAGELQV